MSIMKLNYYDTPDYKLIRDELDDCELLLKLKDVLKLEELKT